MDQAELCLTLCLSLLTSGLPHAWGQVTNNPGDGSLGSLQISVEVRWSPARHLAQLDMLGAVRGVKEEGWSPDAWSWRC